MNSAGNNEADNSSDNHSISQQIEEIQASSSLYSNETRQGQKRISISPFPILRHLGLARGNALSSNGDELCRLTPSAASSALSSDHNAEPPLHSCTSVSGVKANNFTKDNLENKEVLHDERNKHIPLDKSRQGSSGRVNMKKSTKGKSQSQTDEPFEETNKSISEGNEQYSPVIMVINTNSSSQDKGCTPDNIIDHIDAFSSPSSFGKWKPAQSKRSKLEHANVKPPPGRTIQDFTSVETECNKIPEENTLIIGQLQQTKESNGSPENYLCHMPAYMDGQNDHSLPTSFGKKKVTRFKPGPANLKDHVALRKQKPKCYQKPPPLFPFDIFQSEREFPNLTEVMFAKDDEHGTEISQPDDGDHSRVLRPGMVLLKGYLTQDEQVSVARECRNLGLGPGGFYQPGYKYGPKLRLMMMCLGRDWDPQTRKYSNRRKIDNSQPPDMPHQFLDMVSGAMIASQSLSKREDEEINVADIHPMMLPDICVVNFYSTTGRLGLHQDRDESPESLAKGLPVVSISVGDSAEFLYGDERDIIKAEKLVLESGDVLIFGGESRHIFHGVDSIIPDSAPESLLKETRLHPGRLNLTFRQF